MFYWCRKSCVGLTLLFFLLRVFTVGAKPTHYISICELGNSEIREHQEKEGSNILVEKTELIVLIINSVLYSGKYNNHLLPTLLLTPPPPL